MAIVHGGAVSLEWMAASTPIRAGDLFLLSSGSYSDYHVYTMLKALRGFDPAEIAKSLKQDREAWNGIERLLAYLLELELAVEVDYREVHVGEYGELDPRVLCHGQAQES